MLVAKWGNSLAVRLPKEAAVSVGIANGAMIDLTASDGAITLRRRRYDIKELVAAIGDSESPPLLLDDAPRGSEIW